MVAGRAPFEGVNAVGVMGAILRAEPAPLTRQAPEAPRELERILSKALRKDREERYQTVKDSLLDLKDLKHKLEFEAELERTLRPEQGERRKGQGESSGGERDRPPAFASRLGPLASAGAAAPTTSSAKVRLGEIKRRKLGVALTLATLVAAVAASIFFFNRPPALASKDTILLADFENRTGDEIFDGTLKQGLAVQLQQSPFLNLFPEARVPQALRLMGRSPDEQVTPEIGREICERQNLKALIAGSIAPLGSHYVIFTGGDLAGMQQQLDWASGKPDEYVAFDWQVGAAAFAGQWRRSSELARRAMDLAARGETKEVAARYAAEQALRLAVWSSNFSLPAAENRKLKLELQTFAQNALHLERGRASLPRAALALALCGETSQVKSLIDELTRRYPDDTVINSVWLPMIGAALELQRGNAQRAITLLQPAGRYEPAAEFWPQYLRGGGYLRLNQATEAAAEFRKILGSRGQAPLSALYPLAHLGLAARRRVTG
jgi:hypothetical protein